jgi:hypothetical protein
MTKSQLAKKKEANELAALLKNFEENHSKVKKQGLQPPSISLNFNPSEKITNVNRILFTQLSVSHQFTNKQFTISHNLKKIRDKFMKDNRRIPFNFYEIQSFLNTNLTLNVIFDKNNNIFSCNNRRLCMFKQLYMMKLFDGKIICKPTKNCGHNVECIQNCKNVPIQMGNRKTVMCASAQII